ncbi:formate dehydrogenase accessory sulfurtransferase FdhD [Candidatus Bipolaricaulota sp. J31]
MRRFQIIRFEAGARIEVEDWVAEEGLLVLALSTGGERRFVITPEKIRAFVYGHLLGEGLIKAPDDLLSYREELDHHVGVPGEVIRVEVSLRTPPRIRDPAGIVWTACEGTFPEPGSGLPALTPRPLVSAEALFEIPRLAAAMAQDFRLTGAYHYAFLFDPAPRLLVAAKDIGRHNAVDKALGEALIGGIEFGNTVLYTTGRLTAEMALKAIRAGVPVVASRGAALLGAVTLARRYNLGLIGFLRGKRFNLYAGEGWVRFPNEPGRRR